MKAIISVIVLTVRREGDIEGLEALLATRGRGRILAAHRPRLVANEVEVRLLEALPREGGAGRGLVVAGGVLAETVGITAPMLR